MKLTARMKEFLRQRRIARLKAKARNAYYEMDSILDEYDCGAHLAEFMSSRYRNAKATYEAATRELSEIDPTYPKKKDRS